MKGTDREKTNGIVNNGTHSLNFANLVPKPKISKITSDGNITISFDKKIIVPSNYDYIEKG